MTTIAASKSSETRAYVGKALIKSIGKNTREKLGCSLNICLTKNTKPIRTTITINKNTYLSQNIIKTAKTKIISIARSLILFNIWIRLKSIFSLSTP